LEGVLSLDERLKSLEAALVSRGMATSPTPWWRNGKTVIVLGALITAILPLITAVNGFLQNRGDSQQLLIEQQDKIRQTYLDRVLKPGLTEGERQRILSLLSRLKGDPELQEWAKEELAKTTANLEALRKEQATAEEQKRSVAAQLIAEKAKNAKLTNQSSSQRTAVIQNLERELARTQEKVAYLQQRIGEPPPSPSSPTQTTAQATPATSTPPSQGEALPVAEPGKMILSRDGRSISCTSPDGSATASITCGPNTTPLCFARPGGDAYAICSGTYGED
jgi:hypothetical protein